VIQILQYSIQCWSIGISWCKIHMWGSQNEVNAELWKVTRTYNWVSFGGAFSWEMVKEGYLWSDLISELLIIVKDGAELTDTFLNALLPNGGRGVGEGDRVCKRKICPAISKPVQWQWISGLCSMLVSNEENFYVWGILWPVCSPELMVLDFFL